MTVRDTSIDRLRDGSFDVLVVGAGINGAVAAASLAGRGASVALVDRGDRLSEAADRLHAALGAS